MFFFCVDGLNPQRKPFVYFADLWIESWTGFFTKKATPIFLEKGNGSFCKEDMLGFQHRLPTSAKELPQLLQVEKWGLGNVKMCLVYSCPRP